MRRYQVAFGNALAVGPSLVRSDRPTYFRAILGGMLVESKGYARNSKRNNYVVEVRGRPGSFALVLDFFVQGDKLRATIQDLDEDIAPWLSICPTIRRFRLAAEISHIPTDDILAGPRMTFTKANHLFIINHRPSPDAT